MAELLPLIVIHSRHFVRHLGICNPICIKLLQLMSGVITHNSVKKGSLAELQPLIVFYSLHFVRHLKFVILFATNFYNWCLVSLRIIDWKNEDAILINGWVTANYSVLWRHFVRHLGIYNPICVKHLQIMSVLFSQIWRNRRLYLKPFSWCPQTRHAHRHTHTHTHTTIA